jgi:hypothetical protein
MTQAIATLCDLIERTEQQAARGERSVWARRVRCRRAPA